eukprot:40729-Eustigmatos_ZCMA.PRE.1
MFITCYAESASEPGGADAERGPCGDGGDARSAAAGVRERAGVPWTTGTPQVRPEASGLSEQELEGPQGDVTVQA